MNEWLCCAYQLADVKPQSSYCPESHTLQLKAVCMFWQSIYFRVSFRLFAAVPARLNCDPVKSMSWKTQLLALHNLVEKSVLSWFDLWLVVVGFFNKFNFKVFSCEPLHLKLLNFSLI